MALLSLPIQATGIQFGNLVQSIVSILTAVIISLIVDPLLGLVFVGFLPFLVVPKVLQIQILSKYNAHYKKHNDQAEKVF